MTFSFNFLLRSRWFYLTALLFVACVITGEQMTVSDALRHGFLDRGRKHFCNPHTNEVYSLDEAIKNGWVLLKSNYDRSKTQTCFSFKGSRS